MLGIVYREGKMAQEAFDPQKGNVQIGHEVDEDIVESMIFDFEINNVSVGGRGAVACIDVLDVSFL